MGERPPLDAALNKLGQHHDDNEHNDGRDEFRHRRNVNAADIEAEQRLLREIAHGSDRNAE